ncbi:hypothetical protein MKX07_001225 [Trichoderma sp. CBMAI-0711]|nr:hypothetical protein MKX07_001225 [Trichoderma sp. CBMAI-0711]
MTSAAPPPQHAAPAQSPITAPPLPRITIQFCTQCKWMLRAAYYAQELLSTFSLAIGEVALQPSTGGTFIVTIHHHHQPSPTSSSNTTTSSSGAGAGAGAGAGVATEIQSTVLWDRKTDGGFPETKDLKRRVRDVIEPGRNLGHVDRDHHRPSASPSTTPSTATTTTAAAGPAAAGAANSASAATLASAGDVQKTTQAAAAAPASSSSSSAATAAARRDAAGQDEDAQKQASSGIVCEDCT